METKSIKITRLYLLTALLILAVALPLSADDDPVESPVNFDVTISTDSLYIGDDFTVRINADYPEDIKLSEPAAKAAEGAFILKSEPKLETRTRNGRRYDEYTFKLSAFETGELGIPIFEFFWYDQQENQHTAKSPSQKIYVKSVLPADTAGIDIKDIIGPKPLPRRWWPYVLIALVIAAVGAVVYWLYRRKMKAVDMPEIPPEPPYDIAIRSLILLKEENLPGKGKIKKYYSELSEIIRYYIQGRFDIIAVEATTYELKRRLKHPELPKDKKTTTLDFLNRSDMVKFAKHIPGSDVIDRDYDLIKDVVVSTKPIEQPVEQQTEPVKAVQ